MSAQVKVDPLEMKRKSRATGAGAGASGHFTNGRDVDAAPSDSSTAATDALEELRRHGRGVIDNVRAAIRARIDLAKLGARDMAITAGLGVLGLLAGAAIVSALVIFVFLGAAHGLGALLGGHTWAGYLIVGVVGLAAVVLGVRAGLRALQARSRDATIERYAKRAAADRAAESKGGSA